MSDKEKIPTIGGDQSIADPAELAWAFPDVDPGSAPLGGRILVQLRRTKKKAGRIILVDETREAEKWNGQVARVVAIGPLAFKHRDTMAPWPEGSWIGVGDYIRVPKWGGDRWERPGPDVEENPELVLFMVLNDHEVIARVTCNPLSFKSYV
jgi:co-chaperonin GroES (HSP10)